MPYTARTRVGFQKTDTSAAGAEQIGARAPSIREAVLDYLRAARKPKTTYEIAEGVKRRYAVVQARVTELKNEGLVRDSGERKISQFGAPNIAWEAVPAQGSLL